MAEFPGSTNVSESEAVYCLNTSLFEIAEMLGGQTKVSKDKLSEEAVSPEQLFDFVESSSEALGIEVKRILVIPKFVSNCRITPGLAEKREQLTSKKDVTTPNIRIMFKQFDNSYKSHAVCSDGSPNSDAKICSLTSKGWMIAMIIEFDSKAKLPEI